jgi:lipopolysaccharide export system permease protein
LHNYEVTAEGKVQLIDPNTNYWEIPLTDFSREKAKSDHPAQLPLHRIPDRIAEQERLIELFEQERASKAAIQMLTGDFASLASAEWKTNHETRRYLQGELARLKTEPHRRASNGFSCICFVLVGMTWSIRWAHGELLSNFFACFLPVLIGYYPILLFGVNSAKEGTFPPYIVWCGNILFAGFGWWMWRRVVRY